MSSLMQQLESNKSLVDAINGFIEDSYDLSKGQTHIFQPQKETVNDLYNIRRKIMSNTKFGQNILVKPLLKTKIGSQIIFNIIFILILV